jgi:hypothetical protein
LAKKKYYRTRYPELKASSQFLQLISPTKEKEDHDFEHISMVGLRRGNMRQFERKQLRDMMIAKKQLATQLEEF